MGTKQMYKEYPKSWVKEFGPPPKDMKDLKTWLEKNANKTNQKEYPFWWGKRNEADEKKWIESNIQKDISPIQNKGGVSITTVKTATANKKSPKIVKKYVPDSKKEGFEINKTTNKLEYVKWKDEKWTTDEKSGYDKIKNYIEKGADKDIGTTKKDKKARRKDFILELFDIKDEQVDNKKKYIKVKVKDLAYDDNDEKKRFGENKKEKQLRVFKAKPKKDSVDWDIDIKMSEISEDDDAGWFAEMNLNEELVVQYGEGDNAKIIKIIKTAEETTTEAAKYSFKFKKPFRYKKVDKDGVESDKISISKEIEINEGEQIKFDDNQITLGSVAGTKNSKKIIEKYSPTAAVKKDGWKINKDNNKLEYFAIKNGNAEKDDT